MLPEYAVVKKRNSKLKITLKAVEVAHAKLKFYSEKAPDLIAKLYKMVNEAEFSGHLHHAKDILKQLMGIDDKILEYIKVLAPYQSAKLESIEVKSHVEHRYVMRSPAPVKNIDDWKQMTGAQELKVADIKKEIAKQAAIVPSLHDFDDPDSTTRH